MMDFSSSSTAERPTSPMATVSGICSPRSRTVILSKTLLHPCWHRASTQPSTNSSAVYSDGTLLRVLFRSLPLSGRVTDASVVRIIGIFMGVLLTVTF